MNNPLQQQTRALSFMFLIRAAILGAPSLGCFINSLTVIEYFAETASMNRPNHFSLFQLEIQAHSITLTVKLKLTTNFMVNCQNLKIVSARHDIAC